jgi:hypothetical protein
MTAPSEAEKSSEIARDRPPRENFGAIDLDRIHRLEATVYRKATNRFAKPLSTRLDTHG